jgi:hypothetical protein
MLCLLIRQANEKKLALLLKFYECFSRLLSLSTKKAYKLRTPNG